jgi:DNA-directed RNA polymerase subunit beta
VKNARVVDYVIVVNAGDSAHKVGDYVEKSEMEKTNADLKDRKKKLVEVEPFSFYLSAWEEDRHTIAQANIELDDKGRIAGELGQRSQGGQLCSRQSRRSGLRRRQPEATSLGRRVARSLPRTR